MEKENNIIILGIETSCDETAASLLEIKRGNVKILSNIVSSQVEAHQKYGGIVPELAAREHLKNIIPVLKKALGKKEVDYLAVTNGPGLITSLLIGIETAKTLAYVWKIPLVGVNHLEGHLYSFLLSQKTEIPNSQFLISNLFPALGLIVSGGHTELVLIKGHGIYKKLGQTVDDAAGECFDKVAKMLKLGYPGGPIIEKLAKNGNPFVYKLPRPMINSQNFNFSFSGLKTAVLYLLRKNFNKNQESIRLRSATADLRNCNPPAAEQFRDNQQLADLCASFQQAIIDVLIYKTIKAVQRYKVKTLLLAGGVAANRALRKAFEQKIKANKLKVNFQSPKIKFCTDNAAMIAMAGYFHVLNKDFTPFEKIKVDPQLEL